MRIIIAALLVIAGFRTAAQESIINRTTLLIAEGKYNDAEKYLDSIIGAEPKNITALMMKGNVILNYSLMQAPTVQNITPDDESIFSKDVATLKNNIAIIPKPTAQKVEQLWKKCLEIDSTRLDLRKGLCSLYGMAVMREELVKYLPVMAKFSQGNEMAYTLAEYARLLHERGDTTGAYRAYREIAELYPTVTGIYCAMAVSYFTDNNLPLAKQYARRGITMVNADLTACHDAIEIYTAIGSATEVLPILKIASRDSAHPGYSFYQGLYKYTTKDATWKADIDQYLKQKHNKPDSTGVYGAALYMRSKGFAYDYANMMALMNYNISDFGTKLLLKPLMEQYKDSLAPYLIAVPVLLNDKDYGEASRLLHMLSAMMPDESNILYYYGYSEYSAGHYQAAIERWSKFAEAKKKSNAPKAAMDGYLAPAYYFIGQSYLKSGNKAKAMEYFKLILAGQDDSKYAYLAKVQLDKITP